MLYLVYLHRWTNIYICIFSYDCIHCRQVTDGYVCKTKDLPKFSDHFRSTPRVVWINGVSFSKVKKKRQKIIVRTFKASFT